MHSQLWPSLVGLGSLVILASPAGLASQVSLVRLVWTGGQVVQLTVGRPVILVILVIHVSLVSLSIVARLAFLVDLVSLIVLVGLIILVSPVTNAILIALVSLGP